MKEVVKFTYIPPYGVPIRGVFVCDNGDLLRILGKPMVCGATSVTLERSMFTVVATEEDEPGFVASFERLNCASGVNPFLYVGDG